jgi:hypothetical protein
MQDSRLRSPDFICIGAPRAGTTWLYKTLQLHPEIWLPPLKEIAYFTKTHPPVLSPSPRSNLFKDIFHLAWYKDVLRVLARMRNVSDLKNVEWWIRYYCGKRNDRWYRSLFAKAPSGSRVGEISPQYTVSGDADIQHMRNIAPDTKILFLIREPLDHFWSRFHFNRRLGRLTGDEMASALKLLSVEDGQPKMLYSRTMRNYARHFPANQILVLFYDAIVDQPAHLLAEIFKFLGVPNCSIDPEKLSERINTTDRSNPMPEEIRAAVLNAYRQEIRVLAQVFGGYASEWEHTLSGREDVPSPGRDRHPPSILLSSEIIAQLDDYARHASLEEQQRAT